MNKKRKSVLKNNQFRHESHPSINIKEDQPISQKEFASFSSYTQRKKKKSKDHKDIRTPSGKYGKFTKNDFVARPSLLDYQDVESGINKSPFRGLLRMFYILGFIYALNLSVKAHRNGKSWSDMNIYQQYKYEIAYLCKSWAQYTLISHISFLI